MLGHRGTSSDVQLLTSAQVQLAEVLLEVGRLQEAQEWVVHAQELQLSTGDNAGMIASTAIKGRILARTGDLDGAIALHRENLERVRTAPSVDPERKLWALANLGRTIWAKGVSERRQDAINESVELLENADSLAAMSLDIGPAQRWIIRSQLGEAWFDAGRVAEGESAAQQAWAYYDSRTVTAHSGFERDSRRSSVGLTRARILLHTAHSQGIQALADWLDEDFDSSIRHLPRLTDDEKRWMLARREVAVRLACQAAIDRPDDRDSVRLALEAVWSWKGLRVDAARRELEVLRNHGSKEEQRLFAKIVDGRQKLAARVLSHARLRNDESLAQLEEVGLQLRRDASALRKGSLGQLGEGVLTPVKLEDVVSAVRPTDAIVEYVVARQWGSDSDRDAKLIAFVVRRGDDGSASVDVRSLGSLGQVSTAIRRMRAELLATIQMVNASPDSWIEVLHEREDRIARRLAEVREIVWVPITTLLAGSSRVFVSVDGPLSSVPFDALSQRVSESWRYRIEDETEPTITRVHTARDLLWWREARMQSANEQRSNRIVLIGAPDFREARAESSRNGFPSWTPVPGLDAYLQTMRDNLIRSLPGASVQAWLGEDATERRVMELSNPAALVLATHGWQWESVEADVLDERAGIDSTIRSMLAMSGANVPTRDDADGLLTAFELVGGPDLRKTHLVVMIACSSGAAESADDGGSLGMRRAMHINGARCIVASLFDVPQKQTLELMDRFQRQWLGGRRVDDESADRLDSFRMAKRATLQTARERDGTAHPLLWAGFEYFGDPGEGEFPKEFFLSTGHQ
jgi:CHAT domain-containing protein